MNQNEDLKYYLGIVRRRFAYFIVAFLAVFALSVVLALKLPPIYRSEAKILVESQQIPSDLVRSTVTGFAAERIEVTRQRITAREALTAIADKFALFPDKRAKLSTTQLVDLMKTRIFILPFDLALAGGAQRGLTVAFTVGFEYERADIAAKVANELVTLILNEDIRSRTSKASETTRFLERESNRLQQELTNAQLALSNFKQEHRDALPQRIPFQMAALERAESSLKLLDREIGDLAETKRMLNLEMSVRNAAKSADPQNPVQANPERQLELLRAELAQKSAIFAPSHPEIKALKTQIDAVEKQISAVSLQIPDPSKLSADQLNRLDINTRIAAEKLEAVDRQVKLSNVQKTSLTTAISALTTVLNEAPEVQINLAIVERQSEGLKKELDDITVKLTAARLGEQLEKDQQAERFQVIEQPITPQDPVSPNRPKIMTLGFFLAGLAGGALAGGLEFLNQGIRTSSDLVKALKRYPLAVIPYIKTQDEGRRRFFKLGLAVMGFVVLVISTLEAIHYYYMPLDLLMAKIVDRLSL